jgi:FkbM family methyltransferase
MDLYHHSTAPFTQWIIANGFLREKFVVIDIGCQGGEHPRWALLGDAVEFYGFDPIQEVIDGLRQAAPPRRRYFAIALGEADEEREFFVSPNTFSSSFFGENGAETTNGRDEVRRGVRKVPVRRLDTLFDQGLVPKADYIKLDCEGFEPYTLRGARNYLAASGPICVTSETMFGLLPRFPYSHLQAVNAVLAEHGLLVVDINIVRAPRPTYAAALRKRPWAEPDILSEVPHLDVGAPGTLDVVFCRDFPREADTADSYAFAAVPAGPPSADQLIKAMINFELHGLMDCAFDVASRFREHLRNRFDVDKAMGLLLVRAPHARNTADVVNCLSMIAKLRADALANADLKRRISEAEAMQRAAALKLDALEQRTAEVRALRSQLQSVYKSHSWRMTAPLRKAAAWLRRPTSRT